MLHTRSHSTFLHVAALELRAPVRADEHYVGLPWFEAFECLHQRGYEPHAVCSQEARTAKQQREAQTPGAVWQESRSDACVAVVFGAQKLCQSAKKETTPWYGAVTPLRLSIAQHSTRGTSVTKKIPKS